MSAHLHIADRDGIGRAVAAAAQHAPHQVPLYRAAHQGLIGIVQPTRDGIISAARFRRMAGKPWVFLLGDDDGMAAGPDKWVCSRRVMSWARQIIIHGAAGRAEHYAGAVAAAMQVHRVALIECPSAQVGTWHEAARRWGPKAFVLRVVPAGGVHPLPMDRSKMQ